MTAPIKQSIVIAGEKYILTKKIEIRYKRPTLFSGPRMKHERYHSLTPFFPLEEIKYANFIDELQKILCETYIPIWMWLLLFIFSLGLLAWIIILKQREKTSEKAKSLVEYVKKINMKLIKRAPQKDLLLFEIPYPTKNKVILHACFYEKVLVEKQDPSNKK